MKRKSEHHAFGYNSTPPVAYRSNHFYSQCERLRVNDPVIDLSNFRHMILYDRPT